MTVKQSHREGLNIDQINRQGYKIDSMLSSPNFSPNPSRLKNYLSGDLNDLKNKPLPNLPEANQLQKMTQRVENRQKVQFLEDDEVNSIAKNLRKQLIEQGPQTSYEVDIKSSPSPNSDFEQYQDESKTPKQEFIDSTREHHQTPRGTRILRTMFKQPGFYNKLKVIKKLSNEFNEMTAEQLKLNQKYNNDLRMFSDNLLSEQKRKFKSTNRKRMKLERIKTKANIMDCLEQTKSDDSESKNNVTTNYFFKHFDIEKILTFKCMAAQCHSVKSKKFMLKKIPKSVFDLRAPVQGSDNQKHSLNIDVNQINLDLLQDWIDLPPGPPRCFFSRCYGHVMIQDSYYMITDLIQDNDFFTYKKAQMLALETELSEVAVPTEKTISKNAYAIIREMELGNLAVLPNIPKFLVKFLLQYVIAITEAFVHAHSHGLIHGCFNLSKVAVQQLQRDDAEQPTPIDIFRQSSIGKNQEEFFDKNTQLNFYLTNFEPWTADVYMKKIKEDPLFEKAILGQKFTPNSDTFKQLVKIKDLHQFGNSILEIMVGKYQDNQQLKTMSDHEALLEQSREPMGSDSHRARQAKKHRKKPITEGISMDALPLNWGRVGVIRFILEMLQLSIGPFGLRNDFMNLDTVAQFRQINTVAINAFQEEFAAEELNLMKLKKLDYDETTHKDRMKASVINNAAIFQFLNLSDDTAFDQRLKIIQKCHQAFNSAIRLSNKQNSAAQINLLLLEYQIGMLPEKQFVDKLFSKVYLQEPEVATMVFILFKKHVMCQHVPDKEFAEVHRIMEDSRSLKSNLALSLYSHSDFQESKAKNLNTLNISQENNLNFKQFNEHERYNQTVKLPEDFKPQQVIFSNNGHFIGLIGGETLFIISSKDGKIVHEMTMPNESKVYLNQTKSVSSSLESEESSMANEGGQDEQTYSAKQGDRKILTGGYGSISSASATAPTKTSATNQAQSKFVQQSNLASLANSTIFTPQDSEIIQGGSSVQSLSQQIKLENLEQNFIQKMSKLMTNDEINSDLARQIFNQMKTKILSENSDLNHSESSKSIADPETGSNKAKERPMSKSYNCSEDSLDSLDQMIRNELVIEEKKLVMAQIPCKWVGSIGNNGNSIALYDKSQMARNQIFKYKQNKQESMIIYSIVIGKAHFDPVVHQLDMRKLLNDNEVLDFGFDQFNENFSQICIQAKNLNLYIIDFTSKQIINRIQQMNSINMCSIFYNNKLKDKNLPMFEFTKEFIEVEEKLGNRVLIPKLDSDFLAVQQGRTNVVKIFSLKLKTFIRTINLELEDIDYTNQTIKTENETYGNIGDEFTLQMRLHQLNQRRQSKITLMEQNETDSDFNLVFRYLKPYAIPSKKDHDRYTEQVMEYERSITQSRYAKNKLMRIRQQEKIDRKNSEIHFIDISPNGSLIVAKIKENLFIRVIKSNFFVSELSCINQYSQEQTIMFMPVYMDEDHNFHINRRFHAKQGKVKNTTLDDLRLSTIGKDEEESKLASQMIVPNDNLPNELIPSQVERACANYTLFLKFQGTMAQKNLILFEIYKVINLVLRKPRLLFTCKLKPLVRYKHINQVLQILRSFHDIEQTTVRCEHINDFHQLLNYNNFNFKRSAEKIESFTSSSDPQKFICAIYSNRKLQVFDYIQNKLLFQVKIPNAGAFINYSNLVFLDNDNLILIQDGKHSVTLINISGELESFQQKDQTRERKVQTIKIEGPIRIENDFNADIKMMEQEDPNSEDEMETISSTTQSKKQIEVKFVIEKVFANRSTAMMASFALVSKTRFAIYNCYDDQMGNVEQSLLWDFDYWFDKNLRGIGNIVCLDFDLQNINVIISTQMGWICILNQQKKELEQKFQIKMDNKKADVITYINADRKDKGLVCYSKSSGVVYQCEISERAEPVKNPNLEARKDQLKKLIQQIEDQLEFKQLKKLQLKDQQEKLFKYERELTQLEKSKPDFKMIKYFKSSPIFRFTSEERAKYGELIKIRSNKTQDNVLFLTMSNGYLIVMSPSVDGVFQIDMSYGPINGNTLQQLFLDDMCSHLAFLDSTSKELKYVLIEYEFSFKKLKDSIVYKTPDPESSDTTEIQQIQPLLTGLQKKLTQQLRKVNTQTLLDKLEKLGSPTKIKDEREDETPTTSKVCSIF